MKRRVAFGKNRNLFVIVILCADRIAYLSTILCCSHKNLYMYIYFLIYW